jgi:phosphatidylserine/phosphatidylglycerophosphate/cardiolipin synthase-like enzyme
MQPTTRHTPVQFLFHKLIQGIPILLLALGPLACMTTLRGQLPSPGYPPSSSASARVAPSPAPGETPTLLLTNWYDLYFTTPEDPASGSYNGGPDQPLVGAIFQARQSIDVAVYDINLFSIRDALIDAHRRGIAVRIVTDSDNIDEDVVQVLKDAGIPVLGDRREGLMHNKFIVIDRQEVWTGSMNLTVNDAYRNNNNLIRIRSPRLAEDYTTEFEEMFTKDLFGPDTLARTPFPTLTVEGTLLEVYFSPDDHTAVRLVELLQSAQHSIYFLAYSFTSDDLADAILQRARQGVKVAGVFETSQTENSAASEYERLRRTAMDVRLDGNPRSMHHKVFIIDGKTVVTGSYNFSSNAEHTNDENTLVIHNAEIAAKYETEFKKIYEAAR